MQVGDRVPAFSVTDLKGKEVSLKDMQGKVVLLHFWATWCPPCLSELPQLAALMQKPGVKGAVLLAVSTDQANPGHVRDFLKAWGVDLEAYQDPGGTVARRYGTFKYPETYVIDREGVLRRKVVGVGDWRDPAWVRYLQEISGRSVVGR